METLSFLGMDPSSADSCDNVVLMCVDFRVHARMCEVLRYAGYYEFDLLAMPGASKSLIDEQTRQTVLDAIGKIIAIHGVKRLIVADHVDCKAYGGSERFASSEDEAAMHQGVLRQAKEIAAARFPELEVILLYADCARVLIVDRSTTGE